MKSTSYNLRYSLIIGSYLLIVFIAIFNLFSLTSPSSINNKIYKSPLTLYPLIGLSLIALVIIIVSWILILKYVKKSSKNLRKY